MCGIIGVTSSNNVQDYIISSLKRLEYRGYDSSGLATIYENKLNLCRAEGKINNLTNKSSIRLTTAEQIDYDNKIYLQNNDVLTVFDDQSFIELKKTWTSLNKIFIHSAFNEIMLLPENTNWKTPVVSEDGHTECITGAMICSLVFWDTCGNEFNSFQKQLDPRQRVLAGCIPRDR